MSAPLFCFYAQVDSGRGVDGRTEFVVGIAAMLQFLKDRTMHSILTVNALVFMEVPPPPPLLRFERYVFFCRSS